MKIYYPAGNRTPGLLNQRQTCYHLSQRELKESIRREIDSTSEDELMHVNSHFLERCQKYVDGGGQNFQHLML